MRTYEHIYIDGEWASPIASGTTELINPATKGVSSRVVTAGIEDIERAVAAARCVFPTFIKSQMGIE